MGNMSTEISEREFSIDDLANTKTGLVSFVAVSEMETSDPDLFVLASETADTEKLGFPIKITSSGSGAGLSHSAALYATIGEGVERYALGLIHPEDLIYGTYNELKKKGFNNIVAPNEWKFFHESQNNLPFDNFDNDTKIAWVKTDSLTLKAEFLIPACLSHIPYYKHFGNNEKVIAAAVSTGAACGYSIPETIYKGICELVERDAFLIMWRNKLSLPRIIIDDKSPIYNTYKEKFDRPALEYILINTTLDLEIPSVFGILINNINPQPAIIVGGAANPNPEIAVLKTLTELVQGLKWMDYIKSETFPIEDEFKNVRSFEDRMKLYSSNDMTKAFDFILKNNRSICLSEIKSIDKNDVTLNLKSILQTLKSKHFNVLARDISTVEAEACGLTVSKVFIPGLETMEGDYLAQHLGNTRWQDIPVKLGLRKSKTEFANINPYPHPYP